LFSDENDKLNYNVSQINGSVLLVSNFTLCDKKGVSGARPDFSLSADKNKANDYYLALQKELEEVYGIDVKLGKFAEDMQIFSHIDGPINITQEY
jgi:D-tyrosyl-tRNA(Tyr) deacylase